MRISVGTRAERPPRRRGRRGALAISLLVSVILGAALADAGSASAALTITSPAQGSATNDVTPSIAGAVQSPPEEAAFCTVDVKVFPGAAVPSEESSGQDISTFGACSWQVTPEAALEPGVYTVKASAMRWPEEGGEGVPEESAPVTFTIDTAPPQLAIASPTAGISAGSGSFAVNGSAGTAEGDLPAVTVHVYPGSALEGPPLQSLEVQASGGSWSGTMAGLAPGSYTLVAEQSDWAGNVGSSPPVPFSVVSPPSPPPPVASFTWFPATPRVGQNVSLVSTSTDASSPLTAFEWGLGATVPLQPGKAVLATSFAKTGPQVVRLRVTDAAGRSATATATINVRPRALTVMQPFPIVRIAGVETSSGVRLKLLTVLAPISSRVIVSARGGGLHARSESRVALAGRASKGGRTTVLSFPRFARSLRAGAVLEIRVTRAGEIGKFTRFAVRRGTLPSRLDSCLAPDGIKPMRCPSG